MTSFHIRPPEVCISREELLNLRNDLILEIADTIIKKKEIPSKGSVDRIVDSLLLGKKLQVSGATVTPRDDRELDAIVKKRLAAEKTELLYMDTGIGQRVQVSQLLRSLNAWDMLEALKMARSRCNGDPAVLYLASAFEKALKRAVRHNKIKTFFINVGLGIFYIAGPFLLLGLFSILFDGCMHH